MPTVLPWRTILNLILIGFSLLDLSAKRYYIKRYLEVHDSIPGSDSDFSLEILMMPFTGIISTKHLSFRKLVLGDYIFQFSADNFFPVLLTSSYFLR